ncbi:MAG: hypothetical protein J4N90_02030 [Chloroflexi bacterium]|nr:hypothetical protein [Chloroflexota bacterium]
MRFSGKANVLITLFLFPAAAVLLIGCSSAAGAPVPTLIPVVESPPAPSPIPTSTTPAPKPTATQVPTALPPPTPQVAPASRPAVIAAAAPVATPAAATEAVSAGPMGKPGGSLRVAGFADIPHRDVHQSVQEALTSMGPGLAYSRLLRLRTGPESGQPSLRLECDLCESWELTGGMDYEFKLRPGVQWQNLPPVSGRPLVADDLVYSYNRLRTPGWPNAQLFSAIEGFEALDPATLLVKMASPEADVLMALADGHSKVVAREVVEQYGDLKEAPVVGTGPWLWQEGAEDTPMILTRNPAYFEQSVPLLDQLEIHVIKRSGLEQSGHQERLAAFLVGQVDVILAPPPQWRELQKSGAQFDSFLSRQSGTGVLLSMNVQSPALSNREVRRAVFKAMDPWDYVDTVWSGQGYASVGVPVQTEDWLLDRAEMRNLHFADPSEARRLLASWSGGEPVNIQLTVRTENFVEVYSQLEERIAEDLKAVGFNPIIRRLNPARFNEIVWGENKDYQLAVGVMPPTSTINSFLLALLHSHGRWNISAHQDRKLDSMIERQAVELDPVRRRDQLKDIQRYVLDQAYLFSPVTGSSRWVFTPGVAGFHPNTALSEYIYWSRVWWEK